VEDDGPDVKHSEAMRREGRDKCGRRKLLVWQTWRRRGVAGCGLDEETN
jgi:hypothetical protein